MSILALEGMFLINRHKFIKEKQREGEFVTKYTTRIRHLKSLCDFPPTVLMTLSEIRSSKIVRLRN